MAPRKKPIGKRKSTNYLHIFGYFLFIIILVVFINFQFINESVFQSATSPSSIIVQQEDNRPNKHPQSTIVQPSSTNKDNFTDLIKYLNTPDKETNHEPFEYVIIKIIDDNYNPTILDLFDESLSENATVFDRFQMNVRKYELYGENDPLLPELLHGLATTSIENIDQQPGGTQFKFIINFEGGGDALAKPMRYPREQETLPNHMYFSDFERHTAEIAAFHLDRLLGFRRTAPVTGRILNLTVIEQMVPDELKETFFISPANNVCFYGNCTYYCTAEHAFCGNGDQLEVSVMAYLPVFEKNEEIHWESPWRRTYHKRLRAKWEKDDLYCYNTVKEDPVYAEGRRILDVIDMVVLDFLIGNQDRHHYETFALFGNESAILHMDHGRGFGKPYFDDPSLLTPIVQCCLIRHSTLAKLLQFHNGPKPLSQLMRESMASDPIAPILLDSHLDALDRRVRILLQTIRNCIHTVAKEIEK